MDAVPFGVLIGVLHLYGQLVCHLRLLGNTLQVLLQLVHHVSELLILVSKFVFQLFLYEGEPCFVIRWDRGLI